MDELLSAIIKIGLENKVNKIILFGSRARGDNTDKSDYDIAFVSSTLTQEQECCISMTIDEIDTFHKIDAVFLKNLNGDDDLTQNILKDGVTLVDKFQQKLTNYKNALARLEESVVEFENLKSLSVRDGAIQRFEFATELAWKTVREYLLSEQVVDINTPKSVMREAFSSGIISDEQGWLQILNDRNSTSHIYDEDTANEFFNRIKEKHIKLFTVLLEKLNGLSN